MSTSCVTQSPHPAHLPRFTTLAATIAAVLAGAAGSSLGAPTHLGDSSLLSTSPTPCDLHGAAGRCSHASMEQAMRLVASQSADPAAAMLAMRLNLSRTPACYSPALSPAQLADMLAQHQALPPVISFEGGLRFFSQSTVWSGDISLSPTGRATRANLTYSFAPDNAPWDGGPSVLNAELNAQFGAANRDRGRELIRQAIASWRRSSGLSYQEVADDGSSRTANTARSATRGDIRIGGRDLGENDGILAYNYFPASGGDMVINTFYFNPPPPPAGEFPYYNTLNTSNTYRALRNLIGHEHGHGLGYLHVVPCEENKLMEPFISTQYEMLTVDERRGAGRNYGDRFAGNHSAADAYNLGDLAAPAPRSVIERDLTTNGVGGAFGSGSDWFRFTLSSPQNVTISATPTGGSYNQGEQLNGCMGAVSLIDATRAGNLNIELRNAAGDSILQSAAAAGPGGTETLNTGVLPAGEYTFRLQDVGPNANFTVQLYDLTVRVGPGAGALAPPQAIAGINKRIAANTNCFFIGNLNSRALETGAVITSYSWDLDGDGVFEIANNAQPTRQYVSNGVHNATLRITDSNGLQATDTITITVTGATTTVTGAYPFGGFRGQTVPVTIFGTNFKNVTSASMVSVGGTGVSVIGTPVSNSTGTAITGLSFVIAGNAAQTARSVTVANADGNATANNAFEVGIRGYYCSSDWNQDDQINSNDISGYLSAWLSSIQNSNLNADFNNDAQVNSNDISSFLTAWLSQVQFGC